MPLTEYIYISLTEYIYIYKNKREAPRVFPRKGKGRERAFFSGGSDLYAAGGYLQN